MPDIEQRLRRCFAAVFPALSDEEITRASAESTAAWDSLASVTLLGVVQEEFEIEIDPFEFADITSFGQMSEHVRGLVLR